jgi:peroxiredoxin Q/BCP
MLKVGERAPEFSLPDQNGRDVSLTSLLNVGALVLWFSSGYSTPANLLAARKIAELHPDLQRRGLVLAGVSPQSPAAHRRMRDRHHLPFELLSDAHKSVARMYEVSGLLGIGVRRGTYLISRGRMILGWVLEPIRINKHVDFMRRAPELVLSMPQHF